MSIPTISPAQLTDIFRSGKSIELIDVRTPVEFREVHLDIAKNVPLDQLNPTAFMQARTGSASDPLYVICRSGSRGQQACEQFAAGLGFHSGFPALLASRLARARASDAAIASGAANACLRNNSS